MGGQRLRRESGAHARDIDDDDQQSRLDETSILHSHEMMMIYYSNSVQKSNEIRMRSHRWLCRLHP